ncbi:hypothetical protein PC9H_002837 [Pleurotus ostreatus]|uniref:Uncharacterized protein n=1 Tax=Pleurotus ostreatus TaxID=5322 RepID=A0A8H7DXF2_PLEOS|nr:uncharacterized protein PC9H_002837 [Pleurotus ostreatus]KAF7436011.1 hypothetical protein PC9H_002837 [Pleurotus ostreatus]KAJ8688830.1 hypothetical protein PTI98_013575 [Pleurotus ostreatus]
MTSIDGVQLRDHINGLLLEYALTHITTDYIQFTEAAVSHLLSDLQIIPAHDPRSLVLPVDPFETLTRTYRLTDLKPHEERWTTSAAETLQYLKSAVKVPRGLSKSERAWLDDGDDRTHITQYFLDEPLLSRKARRETPRLGEGTRTTLVPSSLLQTVDVPAIVEPPQNIDHVLNLRVQLTTAMLTSVNELCKSTQALGQKKPGHPDKLCPPMLDLSPSNAYSPFEPIFPRHHRLGGVPASTSPRHGAKSYADIELSTAPTESSDNDLHISNLAVVNGWGSSRQSHPLSQLYSRVYETETYTASSPSSPSTPMSDEEDELDQLFEMSSPTTEPFPIQKVMDAKMDEWLIPRKDQPGGTYDKPFALSGHQTLASVLPFVPQKGIPGDLGAKSEKLRKNRSPETATSMIGLPPSSSPANECGSDDSLNVDLRNICGGIDKQDPKDMIMKEQLEEQPFRDSFMDVPILPPPNIHAPHETLIPIALRSLLVAQKPKNAASAKQATPRPDHEFLTKCKGMFSLNTRLSWSPWTSDTRIPTSEELINELDHATAHLEYDKTSVDRLFLQALAVDEFDTKELDHWTWNSDDHSPDTPLALHTEFADLSEAILTRQERRRVAGLDPYAGFDVDDIEAETPDFQTSELRATAKKKHPLPTTLTDDVDSPIVAKRRATDDNMDSSATHRPVDVDDTEKKDNGYRGPRLSKRRRTDSWPASIDDSGIGLEPFSLLNHAGASSINPESSRAIAYEDEDPRASHPLIWSQGNRQSNPPPLLAGNLEPERLSPLPAPSLRSADHNLEVDIPIESLTVDTRVDGYGTLPKEQPAGRLRFTDDFSEAFRESCFSRVLGPGLFAKLRAKKVSEPIEQPQPPTPAPRPASAPQAEVDREFHGVPEELCDPQTIRLPPGLNPPQTTHRYLASLDVIQKQVLVRSLRGDTALIQLVERESLNGAHLILDPHSAVLLVPLLALPSECDRISTLISQQSWCYSQLLVVFEAYPASLSHREHKSTIDAYTPPILKAVKKLRRDLGIAEACVTKNHECGVFWAFADSPQDVAVFVRVFGDSVEASDQSQGVLWGDRGWLSDDTLENESDLASISGMNPFAAYVILCHASLDEFLDMGPDARSEMFGAFVGHDRLTRLNQFIERRLEEVNADSSESAGVEHSSPQHVSY